jgi:adenylate cyclase
VTILSAAIGTMFPAGAHPAGRDVVLAAATGGLTGFLIILLEILLQGPGAITMRRLPVLVVLGLRTVLYGAIFLGAAAAATIVVSLVRGEALPAGAGLLSSFNLLLSFGLGIGFNLVFILRALLGPGTLIALLLGRYHQPRREQRIVLFLDLRGSTQLAERLGDTDFLRFLNRVFYDLADPVIEAGGEIYRYVGDEIIVTWRSGRHAERAATCAFAIEDALKRRSADYIRTFGAAPHLRAALHAGPLVIGEMGDLKREIVMLGDTMNTAARIEEACRTTGSDYIASEQALRAVGALPSDLRAESLGRVPLRGKESDIELFALSRA